MRSLFPSSSNWQIIIVKLQKQMDNFNCGPNICHFSEQIAKGEPITSVTCHLTFRQHMYSFIVGGCLKRLEESLEICGICSTPYGSDEDDAAIWVCCYQCHQWFHKMCVNFNCSSDNNFVCPWITKIVVWHISLYFFSVNQAFFYNFSFH